MSLWELLENIEDDENIGAFIFEYDVNLNLHKIQKALTYLKRKDCLYLIGSGDKVAPIKGTLLHCKYKICCNS